MNVMLRRVAALVFQVLVLAGGMQVVCAHDASTAGKPFAEHHIALQISDGSQEKQKLVLSIAYKLLEVYGPDSIDVQVVAFGPGIDLLRADSPNRKRVDSLIEQGVRFNVCSYTIETIAKKTGKRPTINPRAVEVANGVPYLLSLSEKHYTIIRP